MSVSRSGRRLAKDRKGVRFARSGQRRGKRSRATCRSLAGQLRISFTDSRMSDEAASQLTLSEEDIPGAKLIEPLESHNVPALRWWLLCRDIRVPSSLKKAKLVERYA